MKKNRDIEPIVFDVARLEDNLRYISRPLVSDMQTAFLVAGYVPIQNYQPPSNSSYLQREIYEIYLYLKDCAEEGEINNITKKGSSFLARLEDWTGYLFHTDQPVVDSLMDAFVHYDRLGLSQNKPIKRNLKNEDKIIFKHMLEVLIPIFPGFPYTYFIPYEPIKKMFSKFNITEKRFSAIASKLLKKKKKRGCVPKEVLKNARESLPHLSPWFDEITKMLENNKTKKGISSNKIFHSASKCTSKAT